MIGCCVYMGMVRSSIRCMIYHLAALGLPRRRPGLSGSGILALRHDHVQDRFVWG